MTFAELPIGARFEFMGDTYTKIGLSVAREETTGDAHVFQEDEGREEVQLIKGP